MAEWHTQSSKSATRSSCSPMNFRVLHLPPGARRHTRQPDHLYGNYRPTLRPGRKSRRYGHHAFGQPVLGGSLRRLTEPFGPCLVSSSAFGRFGARRVGKAQQGSICKDGQRREDTITATILIYPAAALEAGSELRRVPPLRSRTHREASRWIFPILGT